jgi:hypothetical protein
LPNAAEVWAALNLVDWADDLADGINGVANHDAVLLYRNLFVVADRWVLLNLWWERYWELSRCVQ